jgi:hypothetical protein
LATAAIGRWRISILATAVMVVSSIILGGLYPWLVQNFQVVPNERTLEAEYIKRNIDATRQAYGLENVELIDYQATTDAEAGALRSDAETTANIRIIDPALVSNSFKQLEQFKQYYGFTSHLDVDRYQIDGKSQDTVVAVRELNQSGLGDSQSWYNNTIVYTHGYGVVAAYGNQRSRASLLLVRLASLSHECISVKVHRLTQSSVLRQAPLRASLIIRLATVKLTRPTQLSTATVAQSLTTSLLDWPTRLSSRANRSCCQMPSPTHRKFSTTAHLASASQRLRHT